MAQAIGLALEIFGLPALTAAITALSIAWCGRRFLAAHIAEKWVLPAAVAIGFFAGYCVLPRAAAPLWPEQSRDWLPYVGLLLAVVSAATVRLVTAMRWVSLGGAITLAACLLTPSWALFGLTRPISIAIPIAHLLLLMVAMETLSPRLLGKSLLLLLAASAALLAIVVGAYLSVRFAQLAALASASLAGGFAAELLIPKNTAAALYGLLPVYVVLVGGVAFVACAEPEPPLVAFLGVPFLPLTLWLAAAAKPASFRL